MKTMRTHWMFGNRVGRDERLEADRVTAVVVLVGMLTIIGLLIWLASLSGGSSVPIDTYWPLLP